MQKKFFIPMLVFSAIQAQLFMWAVAAQNWFFMGLLGILLVSDVRSAYRLEKIAKERGLI